MLEKLFGRLGVTGGNALKERIAGRAGAVAARVSENGWRATLSTTIAPRMYSGMGYGAAGMATANMLQYSAFGGRDGRRSFGGLMGAGFRGALGGAAVGAMGGLGWAAMRPGAAAAAAESSAAAAGRRGVTIASRGFARRGSGVESTWRRSAREFTGSRLTNGRFSMRTGTVNMTPPSPAAAVINSGKRRRPGVRRRR